MLDVPNVSSHDIRTGNNLDPTRGLSDQLGRSQSVRRNSSIPPSDVSISLGRSASLRLPNRTAGSVRSGSITGLKPSESNTGVSGGGGSSGGVGFRRMSKFLHDSLLGGENAKQEFTRLFEEQEFSQIEFRRLRQHLERLAHEYEEMQRSNNWLTKYADLKAIIKRSVMHLKVGPSEDSGVSIAVAKEIGRKIEEMYQELDSESLAKEKTSLREQTEINRQRIATLRSVFNDLDLQYSASKKYSALSRYQMLNALVKDLLSRPNIKEIL